MKGTYFGYDGPAPPWNDSVVHHYAFTLYAVDDNGNIQEKPMKELNTRKRSGNLAALLGYVIGTAGDIYVIADEDEGFGGFWDVLPLELGIAVLNAKWWIGSIRPKANSAVLDSRFESSDCLAAWKIFSLAISPLGRSRSDENSTSVSGITILIRHDCLWLVACRA